MALSQIVKQTCKVCGKVAEELTFVKLGDTKLITLKCGHMVTEQAMGKAILSYEDIVSSDGRRLMPYQIDGVKFMELANARMILGDQQGLGKTVQIAALLKLHPELLPAIIEVKTTITEQWRHEIIRWCGHQGYLTQVIKSGKEFAAPGFNIYIITYDLAKNEKMWDYVKDDIKTLVIDECQVIKDHTSERAKAVQKIAKFPNVEHIIPMSGTAIKNNAGEYFTVLNLVKPQMFPYYNKFIENECDSYHNGWGYKVGGLKNPDAFAEKTKDFILRRTKDEVLKDLPAKSRRFQHVELAGKVKRAYTALLKELEDVLYDDKMDAMQSGAAKIAIMSKMRHITGISKVPAAVDSVLEFLEDKSHNKKLTVFTHHDLVMDGLVNELLDPMKEMGYAPPLKFHAGLSSDKRHELTSKFRDDYSARIMVASTLAAGTGLNLQFCSDCIMLERQWNPADEEQAEDRFHRHGQTNNVTINYMICSETIDEYFTELVEQKRAIVAAALDNKAIIWDQNSLMSELAAILVTKGTKAWSL